MTQDQSAAVGDDAAGATAEDEATAYEEAERWSTVVHGHHVEGRFHKSWPEKKAWLVVDGTCVGRAEDDGVLRIRATSGALANAGWTLEERRGTPFTSGATLEVRHARGRPYDMDLVPGAGAVPGPSAIARTVGLTPPAGSRAERFQALRSRRPRVAAARFLVMKLGWLVWPLLVLLFGPLVDRIIAWLEHFLPDLPDIPWPRIPWPDIHWPRIPWPDLPRIPRPDLPDIPWPDLSWLFAWLAPLKPVILWVLDHDKLIWGVVLGLVLARGELKRQRARDEAAEAERRAELARLARAMRDVAQRGGGARVTHALRQRAEQVQRGED
ncbi:hypothetical protein [Kytococcus schroeteri]|uniref:hypothetical protein n=1 Tax=Kytococcus schroeteri TaxID=138300 RepID=UPI001143ED58|nr:hypothetical protein [Kytococcus schroeteri]